MTYYPEQTYILPLTTIARDRTLPADGEILARQGEVVVSADLVARAMAPARRVILDVAEELGVPPDKVENHLRVDVNDSVEDGQVLAQRRRFLRRRAVTSPVDGTVARIEGGRMVLETEQETIELKAVMPGTVTSIMPGRGVQIQIVGALIQGVWGNGGVNAGVLHVIGDERDEKLSASAITLDQRGAVIATPVPIDASVIEAAASPEHRLRGLIAPSIHAADIASAKAVDGVPVVLTEGFGRRKMSQLIYNLLRDHEGREAVLIANEPERWNPNRPEIIIPLMAGDRLPDAPRYGATLEVQSRVRLLRAPFIGQTGTVGELTFERLAVESGLHAHGAWVELDSGGRTFVPLANLEIIG
jgi:hypothetical protein